MLDNIINQRYGEANGFQVCDDVYAQLGITAEEGQHVKICIEQKAYKNFTITGDDFTGDECNYTDGVWGYSFSGNTGDNYGTPEMFDYAIEAGYDDPEVRIALALGPNMSGSDINSYSLIVRSYKPSSEAFGFGVPFQYRNMSDTGYIYLCGIPYSTDPGYITQLDPKIDYLNRFGFNSLVSEPSYLGVYYNLAKISTNIPIFDTLEHADAYLADLSDETTQGLLNLDRTDPADVYDEARNYRYINNIYGHNANNMTQYTGYRNYRFYGGDGKICLVRTRSTSGSPYTVKLYHYSSYTVKAAGINDNDDDDYTVISSPETTYIHKSVQFSDSDYYKVFKWQTDLLIFGSEALADMWIRDEIDARQAENYNEVSRVYDDIIDPGYGNPDPGYDNGLNGQSYVHGARLWVLDSGQLNAFFDDIFDPLQIQSLLDGTKLFGSNEIGAIQGITYFPLDIDDVARVNGTAQAIKIGSYTCPTATGRFVWNNNKMIDCGSVFIAPVYNDFRDYEIKLFIQLPYVGTHELNISKFINHNLEVYYAVDITTGGCTAHVLADGISYGDSYDGFMASQRPLTALDQTAYLNSVMGCVSSIVNREAGMISTAKNAIAGVATGNAQQVAQSSDFSGIKTSMGAISDLYGLSQAVKEVPMSTRGGFAGCLGFFGNQQIHIITVQSKTVKPLLEQQLVGYPSHVSQRIGNFSGFLKCSAININNFSGTAQELQDIHNALMSGVYL